MKQWLLCGILYLALWQTAFANTPPRPAWCQKGWECIPTEEVAADAEYHLDLQEQILHYRARGRRIGWTLGPGIGVAGVVDSDYTVHWVPTAGFFLVFGLRF